ncbi:MAG: tetratricopeptide repeat protein [Balneolaceae bacterium]|nr:tetratricopeptide repeat protein [Balneolaceae bacterium]
MPATNNKIKQLAQNIKANPDDSFSKFALALEFLKQDNLQRAKILFEDVYNNDPDYVGVYYHLGKLYERLEQLDDAKKVYTEGIDVAAKQKEQRTLKELEEALAEVNIEIEN